MSPQVSVGMIIRYASHNLRFIYSTNTKDLKECPKVSTRESRRKRVPTPMHRFMGGTRKLITKTYIKWIIEYPIVTTGIPRKTYIKCSQIFKDSIRWDNSKGETQFITREKRGRRNIGSNYNSKARDTSRSRQIKNTREIERERSNT